MPRQQMPVKPHMMRPQASTPHSPITFPFYETNALFEQIRLGETERALRVLRGIQVKTKPLHANLLRMVALQLATTATRAAAFGGADLNRLAVEQQEVFSSLDSNSAKRLWRELERWIRRLCQLVKAGRSSPESDLIVWAKEYIERNKDQKIRAQDVADQLLLNPSYFGRLFKRETGYTFTDYLNRVRIRTAVEMLSNTHLSVQKVSSKVGFSSVHYFCKIFRRYMGMTPTQFRQLLKEGAYIEERFRVAAHKKVSLRNGVAYHG